MVNNQMFQQNSSQSFAFLIEQNHIVKMVSSILHEMWKNLKHECKTHLQSFLTRIE